MQKADQALEISRVRSAPALLHNAGRESHSQDAITHGVFRDPANDLSQNR
jgi:hypothetical protein